MTRQVMVSRVAALAGEIDLPDRFVRDLRRADDFIRLAVVCGWQALDTAPKREVTAEQTGVFIGTAFGPLETNFCSLGSLIDDGEGQISPTLFSHSVYNAAAGYVARLLDIRGPALTITTYGWPFINALNEARAAIAFGRIERALVIGVETYSGLLEDAYRRSYNTETVPWHKGAVAWLLEPDDQKNTAKCCLGEIIITEHDCDPADYLTRSGEEWSGEGLSADNQRHPMAHAFAMTRAVAEGGARLPGEWRIQASFGRVQMILV